MLDLKNPESITLLVSLFGGLCTLFSLLWVKLIKPIVKLVQTHEQVRKNIGDIKKELMTNGGNSLKDSIIELKGTCNRIETRQKIMEQRTRAALHYNNAALFETDDHGRLIWTNNSFYELTSDSVTNVDGYDWLTYIHEDDREELFLELKSCLDMNRKFVKVTRSCDGKNIKLVGFPYKINENTHGGFLISISEVKEN